MKAITSTLKFAPCVAAVALLVLWPTSLFYNLVARHRSGVGTFVFESTVSCYFRWPMHVDHVEYVQISSPLDLPAILGQLRFADAGTFYLVKLPIPFVLTCIFPLIVGPFNRYRFRLWHSFAWIMLIAVELAYYCGNAT